MTSACEQHGGPTAWMRRVLQEWLPPNAADPEQLTNWLSGRRLPPVGDDDEPYVWILRGLPQGNQRPAAERAVAEVLAGLLDAEIDRTTGPYADKLLYNLFMLAAGVSWPDTLCEPLDRSLERTPLAGRSWRGIPLTAALRAAVIENQLDNRHEEKWQSMLAGKPHPYLGGLYTSGFDGILWMPPSAEQRGRPALRTVARALRSIAQYLDSDPDLRENRHVEFRTYLERVRKAYTGQITDKVFLEMAAGEHWPEWTVQSLPRLAFVLASSAGTVDVIAPDEWGARLGIKNVDARPWAGRMVRGSVPESQRAAFELEADALERERRESGGGPMLAIRARATAPETKGPGRQDGKATSPRRRNSTR